MRGRYAFDEGGLRRAIAAVHRALDALADGSTAGRPSGDGDPPDPLTPPREIRLRVAGVRGPLDLARLVGDLSRAPGVLSVVPGALGAGSAELVVTARPAALPEALAALPEPWRAVLPGERQSRRERG